MYLNKNRKVGMYKAVQACNVYECFSSESFWVPCIASAVMADGSCNHNYLICGHFPFPAQCLDPGLSTHPMQNGNQH